MITVIYFLFPYCYLVCFLLHCGHKELDSPNLTSRVSFSCSFKQEKMQNRDPGNKIYYLPGISPLLLLLEQELNKQPQDKK